MPHETESLTPIANVVIEKIDDLAEKYKKHGFSALTVAAGLALMVFTFVVAIQTDPANPGSSSLNVSEIESMLFLSSGILLVALGGINLIVKNLLINRMDTLSIQVRIEGMRANSRNMEILQQATEAIAKSNMLLAELKPRGPADG